MQVEVVFIPGGIEINGVLLEGEVFCRDWERVLGEPSRIQSIQSMGKPWREVLLYDDLGIYAVEDIEERRIVYVCFALTPTETSFPTRMGFSGKLKINDSLIGAGMRAEEMRLRGDLKFVKGIGSVLKYAHDNGYVELNFARPLDAMGRRRGKQLLFSVTHSFLKD